MELLECSYCGKELDEEELENPYTDDCDSVMCDDCYTQNYQQQCPICEDNFDKPTKPEELFFVVAKEVCGDVASEPIKPGIYQTTCWPYYLGSTGFGFETLFGGSIKLVRELDINSMLKKLHRSSDPIGADEICPDCVEKFTNLKYKRRTEYCDKFYRLHLNIYERGVIKEGK